MTEIICVIDKSGSMWSIKDDAIGGFNAFLEDQKALPGEANMTVVLFDTKYVFYAEGKNIQDVTPLNENTYIPGGYTALLDAVGTTIDKTIERLAGKDTPVLMVILTDGHENASHEYSRDQIISRIKHQTEAAKWEFKYLGANQDAFAEAGKLGIAIQDALNFSATSAGLRSAYKSVSCMTTSFRTDSGGN